MPGCVVGTVGSICNGDLFFYSHWGPGNCIASWVEGELWVRRIDEQSTSGAGIFKTTNGDGVRLLNGHEIQILWDNTWSLQARMVDANTIWREGGYEFTRVSYLAYSWTHCANEMGTCVCDGMVRYGDAASDTWSSTQTSSGSISCGNSVFGDPKYGAVKTCQCSVGGQACEAGKYNAPGASACTACEPGKYSPGGGACSSTLLPTLWLCLATCSLDLSRMRVWQVLESASVEHVLIDVTSHMNPTLCSVQVPLATHAHTHTLTHTLTHTHTLAAKRVKYLCLTIA